MIQQKFCDFPSCGQPARTVRVTVEVLSDDPQAVGAIGAVHEMDACDAHREAAYTALFNECVAGLP